MPKPTADDKAKRMRAVLKKISGLVERGTAEKQAKTAHFHTVHAWVFNELVELHQEIVDASR